VPLEVPVLVVFQAPLVVDVHSGRKLKAGLHLRISLLGAYLVKSSVSRRAQEGHDVPVLLGCSVFLSTCVTSSCCW
jgi:hypothetical protein